MVSSPPLHVLTEEPVDDNEKQVPSASESETSHPPETSSLPPPKMTSSTHMDSARVIDACCTSTEPITSPKLEESLPHSPLLSSPSLPSQDSEVPVDATEGFAGNIQIQDPTPLDDEAMNGETLVDHFC
ncbi:hypothetical protein V6N13_001664 [Hibiscus sabdariffa]|uniref:Uncharacterized protein n=1 Tax=Hibiscus sabdariffa TaxID=183260 RepID=A0ABR2G8Y1_9ROSI